MNLATYASYFLLVTTLVYTPGPMTLFLLAQGLNKNFREVLPILIGGSTSYLLSIFIFSFGLSSLIHGHKGAMLATNLLGVLSLLYLAYKQLSSPNGLHIDDNINNQAKQEGFLKKFLSGFWVAASNPKSIVLFTLIFPDFVDSSGSYGYQIAILSITFLILQFSSGSLYTYAGKYIRVFVETPCYRARVRQFCAVVLVLVAIFLMYNGRGLYLF